VSTTITQNIRSSDFLARYGGEEFALILPETSLADAEVLAERVRAAVEAMRFREVPGEVTLTISAGVAALPAAELTTVSRLVEAADQALYLAKSNGRNRVERYGAKPNGTRTRTADADEADAPPPQTT
jgi:two-component system cell cycle response regulator